MANTKISGLSSASTPLSGSEILPLNQSGTTDSVTVNNFTNGRSVGMSQANITNNGSLIKLNYAADGGSNVISWINTSSTTLWDMGGGITIRQDEFTIRRQGTNVIYCDNNYNVAFSSGNLVQGTAGKGINFTANTPASGMTSQNLTWYETGSWTPTDGSGASLSLSVASALYTRTGNTVFIQLYVTYPSTLNTSTAVISGLPFTAASGQNYSYLFGRNNTGSSIVGQINAASKNISFYNSADTSQTNLNLSGKYLILSGTYIAA